MFIHNFSKDIFHLGLIKRIFWFKSICILKSYRTSHAHLTDLNEVTRQTEKACRGNEMRKNICSTFYLFRNKWRQKCSTSSLILKHYGIIQKGKNMQLTQCCKALLVFERFLQLFDRYRQFDSMRSSRELHEMWVEQLR